MTKITPQPAPAKTGYSEDQEFEEEFKPLSADEARQWRLEHPQLPLSRVLKIQFLTGLVVVALCWMLTGQPVLVWSAAYGALVGWLPSWLAARGMARWAATGVAAAALGGFLLWEVVKLSLTVGMLMAAPKILGAPNWPALLVGLVLTIKVYWVALLVFRPRASSSR